VSFGLFLLVYEKYVGISRMSTEHYKQKLREAMRKVRRAEALEVRALRAESDAFSKKLSKSNVNANSSYNKSLRVSAKAKNLLNRAYQSLNGVKQEIRESMKRSSMQRSSMKKGGKRTHRKRKHSTRKRTRRH
jgi:hypothetical protein